MPFVVDYTYLDSFMRKKSRSFATCNMFSAPVLAPHMPHAPGLQAGGDGIHRAVQHYLGYNLYENDLIEVIKYFENINNFNIN